MIRLLFILLLSLAATAPVHAEELSLLGGMMQAFRTSETSYSWQLEYRNRLSEHISASVSYLNEGHVREHHRDGHALELWARTDLLEDRLTLAVGAGPYFYFDTTAAKSGGSYRDNHHWGVLLSLGATWHMEQDLLLQVRANGIKDSASHDTVAVLAGIGLYLEGRKVHRPEVVRKNDRTRAGGNEVTLFLGQTIVNSFNSDKSVAAGIEYRRRLMGYLDGTIGWIYEGDNRLTRRNGLAIQLWGVKDYLDKRVTVGMGAGSYIAVDRYYDLEKQSHHEDRSVSAIVTLTTCYLLYPQVAVRVSWHRIVTDYDRDTDVLLAGVGYRF